jgi:hypothetical protein
MNKREWMLQAALVSRVGKTCRTVADIGALYDAICAATAPETDWVEHDGDVSKAPEEGRMVVVVERDGSTTEGPEHAWAWDHDGSDHDVVRWRYA